MDDDIKYMKTALAEAKKAFLKDEVPVGCVIVKEGKVIAKAHNEREGKQDATSHAEITCIMRACGKLGTFRLNDCDLYVTLEPCPMCAGAIINARVKRVIFGAYDPKAGCCGTLYNLTEDGRFNHTAPAKGGVMEEGVLGNPKEFFCGKEKGRKSPKLFDERG